VSATGQTPDVTADLDEVVVAPEGTGTPIGTGPRFRIGGDRDYYRYHERGPRAESPELPRGRARERGDRSGDGRRSGLGGDPAALTPGL